MVSMIRCQCMIYAVPLATLVLEACGDRPESGSVARESPYEDLTSNDPTTDGDGWYIEDSRCVITAGPPTCEPRHLGDVPPPPPGASTCEVQSDCDDFSFCGAGHCRPREGTGELLTLCMEEVWYEGDLVPPLSGQVVVFAGSLEDISEPKDPTHRLRHSIASPGGEACRLVARRCERFPASSVQLHWLSRRGHPTEAGGECEALGPHKTLYLTWGDYESRQPISDHLDHGCFDRDLYHEGAKIWFSVWYP